MEDHKVSRADRVSVRNRYTIFLCEDDFDRLMSDRDGLVAKLERHLTKHVRSKRYQTSGDILVDIELDTDLKLGHFGILAEREAPGFLDQDLVPRSVQDVPVEEDWPAPAQAQEKARATRREAESSLPLVSPRAAASPRNGGPRSEESEQGGTTRVIVPADAADLGLARTTIVIRSGNRVREFTQGRVVLGRARDADFRIDNPDVSRRHAVIYWSNGQVMLEDLGSTNGTMVNGYPISSTVVTPRDVVVIGDCRMNIDIR